jgi:hypothetical protein
MNEHQEPTVEHERTVAIIVNTHEYRIDRGVEKVAEIKKIGHVPLADDLEQVIAGKLVPLPDDGSVDIKGGERFISHPKDSGSS